MQSEHKRGNIKKIKGYQMLLNEDKFIKKYILNDDGHDAENDDGG